MKLSQINTILLKSNISFSGEIIDCHTHIGSWCSDGLTGDKKITPTKLSGLIRDSFQVNVNGQPQTDEVIHAIVSNLDCIDGMTVKNPRIHGGNELEGNLDLLKSCEDHPKLKPVAVCQPGVGKPEEIDKLLRENPDKFFGLKFHPMSLELKADDNLYTDYLKLAEKYKLPCVFHSDKIGSFADPEAIYTLAKKFPKVPIILYHMGMGNSDDNQNAIRILQESLKKGEANLYADISWVDTHNPDKPTIIKALEALDPKNADRILFGTDSPLGEFGREEGFYSKTIGDIKTAIMKRYPQEGESIIQKIFRDTSQELFFTKNWTKNVPETVEKVTTKNTRKFVLLGIALLGVISFSGYTFLKNKKNTKIIPPAMQTQANHPIMRNVNKNAVPKTFDEFIKSRI
jgi:predicted TIM-barrel fold metal-dependent hydrolase